MKNGGPSAPLTPPKPPQGQGQVEKMRCPGCHKQFVVPQVRGQKMIQCPHCHLKIDTGGTEDQDQLVGAKISGFRLLKRLGQGSMGRVYQATAPDGGLVAVKVLSNRAAHDKELSARFDREAELLCSVKHPNLARGIETGEIKGARYLVMQLVGGKALDKTIKERQTIPWQQALDIMIQITSAMAELHSREVLHRDLKPGNIMIDETGHATLLDLGFAKAASNPGEAALTMQGAVLGSPAYMAPEQVIDSSSATSATDVYGLGATLYHCITGITPFNGRTVMEVMERVVRSPLVPPKQVKSDVPDGVQALILWAMDKEAENRPADAGMLLEAMQAVRQEPKNAKVIFKRAGAGSPSWVWWVVGTVVAVAILGILALFLHK